MRNKSFTLFFLVILTVILTVTACGGGNETPTPPPLAVPTSTPAPTASVVEVAVDNSDLGVLSITGTMLPPRIDEDGWPWIRILLGGGVYEFPAPDTADGERLYIVAQALALEGANVEVIVSTQFIAALQLASNNGNQWVWSPEGGGLSEFGWEIYNAYMALDPIPATTPKPFVLDPGTSTTLVAGQIAVIPACEGEVQYVNMTYQSDVYFLLEGGKSSLYTSSTVGYGGDTLACGQGIISYELDEDGVLELAYDEAPAPSVQPTTAAPLTATITAPTPNPTPTPYSGYECNGEWTRITTGRAWLAYDGGSADSRIVVGRAKSRKDGEVVEFTWATWARGPEALVNEFNNLLGWDVQALFSCTDSPLGTPYLQKLYVGGDRQQEIWTTEPLAWPEGVTIDELNLTGEATSFVDVPLQVTVLEKHPRIIDPSGIWPQVEAPADTLEAVSLGVVEGLAYSKGSCPGPEMEVGIVNDGLLADDTILCMGPNQWVEVEFTKTDFLTMTKTTGRFFWAPGNEEGSRSSNVYPPTDPIGTYYFNGDTREFGLRLAGQ